VDEGVEVAAVFDAVGEMGSIHGDQYVLIYHELSCTLFRSSITLAQVY
jgi:hypothetical protein